MRFRTRLQEVGWPGWLIPALVSLLFLLLAQTRIALPGLGVDELNFMYLGRHLQWGYADGMPTAPTMAGFSYWLFGFYSPWTLRLIPTLALSLTVFLVGLLARDLGGGRWAQLLACLGMASAPVVLAGCLHLAVMSFEPLCWVLFYGALVRVLRRQGWREWLLLGVAAGMALNTCLTMLVGMGAVFVGLLLTRPRLLRSWKPYGAAGLALLALAPSLIWGTQNGWPQVEYYSNRWSMALAEVNWWELLSGQMVYHGIWGWLLAVLGWWACWFNGGHLSGISRLSKSSLRALALVSFICLEFFLCTNSDIYYLTPAYVLLWAVGGVVCEVLCVRLPVRSGALVAAALLAVLQAWWLGAILTRFIRIDDPERYTKAVSLGIWQDPEIYPARMMWAVGRGQSWEGRLLALDGLSRQWQQVAGEKPLLITDDYGYFGAVEELGNAGGLTAMEVSSPALNMYFVGLRNPRPKVVLAVRCGGNTLEALERCFRTVKPWRLSVDPGSVAGSVDHKGRAAKVYLDMLVCCDPRYPLEREWPNMRSMCNE